MQLTISLDDQPYTVNTDYSFCAAISLKFNQAQPNHFSAPQATSKPMQAGSFIGDTEQGGSCNVNQLSFNPHCNGTHTETIRHICDSSAELSLPVSAIWLPPMMPCVLISVSPMPAINCEDDYTPTLEDNDMLITRCMLEAALSDYSNAQLQALAVRTLPNDISKQITAYNSENQPSFFSRDAILYLNERGVEHLLVDIPSIDRLHDDGLLTCHHLFWQVIEGMHQPTTNSLINKTITEMAYFDEQIADGFYFLNLQMPAFENDAAPSKPVFYSAEKQKQY